MDRQEELLKFLQSKGLYEGVDLQRFKRGLMDEAKAQTLFEAMKSDGSLDADIDYDYWRDYHNIPAAQKKSQAEIQAGLGAASKPSSPLSSGVDFTAPIQDVARQTAAIAEQQRPAAPTPTPTPQRPEMPPRTFAGREIPAPVAPGREEQEIVRQDVAAMQQMQANQLAQQRAQPIAQGREVFGQVQSDFPVKSGDTAIKELEQARKERQAGERTAAEKFILGTPETSIPVPEKVQNFFKDTRLGRILASNVRQAGATTAKFGAGALNIPELFANTMENIAIDAASAPLRKQLQEGKITQEQFNAYTSAARNAAKKVQMNAPVMTPRKLEKFADDFLNADELEDRARKNLQEVNSRIANSDKGFEGLINEGRIADAFEYAASNIGQMLPYGVAAALPGGLILIGAEAAQDKYRSIEDRVGAENMRSKETINAIATGATEAITEGVTKKLLQGAALLIKAGGKVNAFKGIKNQALNLFLRVFGDFNKEGASEWAAQLAENIIDILTIDPNKNPKEGLLDSYVLGGVGGGAITATAGAISLARGRGQAPAPATNAPATPAGAAPTAPPATPDAQPQAPAPTRKTFGPLGETAPDAKEYAEQVLIANGAEGEQLTPEQARTAVEGYLDSIGELDEDTGAMVRPTSDPALAAIYDDVESRIDEIAQAVVDLSATPKPTQGSPAEQAAQTPIDRLAREIYDIYGGQELTQEQANNIIDEHLASLTSKNELGETVYSAGYDQVLMAGDQIANKIVELSKQPADATQKVEQVQPQGGERQYTRAQEVQDQAPAEAGIGDSAVSGGVQPEAQVAPEATVEPTAPPQEAVAPTDLTAPQPEVTTPATNLEAAPTQPVQAPEGGLPEGFQQISAEEEAKQEQEEIKLRRGMAAERRKAGRYTKGSVEYVRNPIDDTSPRGNTEAIYFTDTLQQQITYKVIEADNLQSSHLGNKVNPMHFIPEAQPKDRTKGSDSVDAQQRIAFRADPNLLGQNTNAYSGAPIVNKRNEVIQGNNRSAGIKLGYGSNSFGRYRQWLIDNTDQFGLDPVQIAAMKNPVLVREANVPDDRAIELGQYVAQDMESGSVRPIDSVALSTKMSDQEKAQIASIIYEDDLADVATMNEVVRAKWKKIVPIMSKHLSGGEKTFLMGRGNNISAEGVTSIIELFEQFLFDGADIDVKRIFKSTMPDKAMKAIRKSLRFIFSVPVEASLIEDMQDAFLAYGAYKKQVEAGGTKNFDLWLNNPTVFEAAPKEIFSPLAIELATRFHTMQREVDLIDVFKRYAALVKEEEGGMFPGERAPLTKAQAVKQIFNVEYETRTEEEAGATGTTGDVGGQGATQLGAQQPTGAEMVEGADVEGETTVAEPTPQPIAPPAPVNQTGTLRNPHTKKLYPNRPAGKFLDVSLVSEAELAGFLKAKTPEAKQKLKAQFKTAKRLQKIADMLGVKVYYGDGTTFGKGEAGTTSTSRSDSDPVQRAIYINFETVKDGTLSHELAHAFLSRSWAKNSETMSNEQIIAKIEQTEKEGIKLKNRLVAILKDSGDADLQQLSKDIEAWAKMYPAHLRGEEYVVELAARLSEGVRNKIVDNSILAKIERAINAFFDALLGKDQIQVRLTDTKDLIDFINTLSKGVVDGDAKSIDAALELYESGRVISPRKTIYWKKQEIKDGKAFVRELTNKINAQDNFDTVKDIESIVNKILAQVFSPGRYIVKFNSAADAAGFVENLNIGAKADNKNSIKISKDVAADMAVAINDHIEQLNINKKQIVGENAQLSQYVRDNLRVANDMESAGKDAKTIRMATGWERGVDGKWRYEIPDVQLKSGELTFQQQLSSVIDADSELLAAYPQLGNIIVNINPYQEERGFYLTAEEAKSQFGLDAPYIYVETSGENLSSANSVLSHEIQHAIQEIEGFAQGGNTFTGGISPKEIFLSKPQKERVAEIDRLINELKNSNLFDVDFSEFDRQRTELFSEKSKILKSVNVSSEVAQYEFYRRLAGEVESRNVQTRIGMTPEQRRETPLRETEDVTREDQIIFYEGGNAMSQIATNLTPEENADMERFTEMFPPVRGITPEPTADETRVIEKLQAEQVKSEETFGKMINAVTVAPVANQDAIAGKPDNTKMRMVQDRTGVIPNGLAGQLTVSGSPHGMHGMFSTILSKMRSVQRQGVTKADAAKAIFAQAFDGKAVHAYTFFDKVRIIDPALITTEREGGKEYYMFNGSGAASILLNSELGQTFLQDLSEGRRNAEFETQAAEIISLYGIDPTTFFNRVYAAQTAFEDGNIAAAEKALNNGRSLIAAITGVGTLTKQEARALENAIINDGALPVKTTGNDRLDSRADAMALALNMDKGVARNILYHLVGKHLTSPLDHNAVDDAIDLSDMEFYPQLSMLTDSDYDNGFERLSFQRVGTGNMHNYTSLPFYNQARDFVARELDKGTFDKDIVAALSRMYPTHLTGFDAKDFFEGIAVRPYRSRVGMDDVSAAVFKLIRHAYRMQWGNAKMELSNIRSFLRDRAYSYDYSIGNDLAPIRQIQRDVEKYLGYLLPKESAAYQKMQLYTSASAFKIDQFTNRFYGDRKALREGKFTDSFISRLAKSAVGSVNEFNTFLVNMHRWERIDRAIDIQERFLSNMYNELASIAQGLGITVQPLGATFDAATARREIASMLAAMNAGNIKSPATKLKINRFTEELASLDQAVGLRDGTDGIVDRFQQYVRSKGINPAGLKPRDLETMPEFADHFAFLREFKGMQIEYLDILRDAGHLNDERYNHLKNGTSGESDVVWDYYTPLVYDEFAFRDEMGFPPTLAESKVATFKIFGISLLRKKRGNVSPVLKKGPITVGMLDLSNLESPVEVFFHRMASAIKFKERNDAINSLANMLEQTGSNKYANFAARYSIQKDRWGTITSANDLIPDRVKNQSVTYYKDGKRRYLYFADPNDPMLAKLNKGFDDFTMWEQFWRHTNNFARAAFTYMNPGFIEASLFRDVMEAGVNIMVESRGLQINNFKAKLGKNFIKYYGKSSKFFLAPMFAKDSEMAEYYREIQELGGFMSWSFDSMELLEDAEAKVKDNIAYAERYAQGRTRAEKLRMSFANSLDALTAISNRVEMMPRLATYASLRQMGIDPIRAAEAAKNITVNFEKKGASNIIRRLSVYYLFLNPSIQGVRKFGKQLYSPEGRKYLLAYAAATAAARGLLYMMPYLAGDDEEERKRIAEKIDRYIYDKWASDTKVLLPNPLDPENPFTAPKPYNGFRLASAIGEGIVDMYVGKKTSADVTENIIRQVKGAFDPIAGTSSYSNQYMDALPLPLLHPFFEAVANVDYQGRPILFDQSGAFDYLKANQGTAQIYHTIAQNVYRYTPGHIDISPTSYEHVIESNFKLGPSRVITNLVKAGNNLTDPESGKTDAERQKHFLKEVISANRVLYNPNISEDDKRDLYNYLSMSSAKMGSWNEEKVKYAERAIVLTKQKMLVNPKVIQDSLDDLLSQIVFSGKLYQKVPGQEITWAQWYSAMSSIGDKRSAAQHKRYINDKINKALEESGNQEQEE